MEYVLAKKEHTEQIYQLVQHTIQTVYPKYYPQGVVEFFCGHHTKENISADIEKGFVRVLFEDGRLIGTGTCVENHILRLFVNPNLQGRGYGSYMMQCLENEISVNYDKVYLDSSLAAALFYEHKGYQTLRHEEISVGDGVTLVYEIMEKSPTFTN